MTNLAVAGRMFGWLSITIMAAAGCQPGESAITGPSYDISAVAQQAIQQYDRDGDGSLASGELQSAASLNSAMAELDADGDKRITHDELVAGLRSWNESGVGLVQVNSQVLMSGRRLVGAQVTFEPESFHGSSLTVATGTTDDRGIALLISEKAKLEGYPDGVQLGFYKVRISKHDKGVETVPAKYNAETTLGVAVSPNSRGNFADFRLKK